MTKATHKKTHVLADDSKTWAFLAYLLSVVGFVLVLMTKKEDTYAMYHAKQSFILFLAWVVTWIIGMIPLIGWLVAWVLVILLLILWIIGMLNALNGKQVPLPVIGGLADKVQI
ncbi:DUF4870 domain-containing protein [Candidatus Woesearchaeota archaeon]|nr:DUF4870 domain-containing protein [Candidatus Woesearchaeota archaeon]